MLDLSSFDGREVFLTVKGNDMESAEVTIHLDLSGLQQQLSEIFSFEGSEIRAYHGILCSARYLPAHMNKSGTFIIMADPTGFHNEGYVFEPASTDMISLADEIETEIQNSDPPVSIDETFVLYGYQLSMCLSVLTESLDEEIMENCEKTREMIEKVKNAAVRRISRGGQL